MRESSYNLNPHSQTPKRFRGGERKVMKKSLSLIVAIALVFTMLAPAMAFAATDQEVAAGKKLEEWGILLGDGQGELYLDRELLRQDMMVLLARLFNKVAEAQATPNTHGWPDVTDPYYDSYISWAKNEGLTVGVGDGSRFGYGEYLNNQSLLQLMLRALGYNDVAWNDVRAKSIELGLISASVDVTKVATRGTMAVVTLQALDTVVNGTDQKLGATLGIEDFIEVEEEVAIASFKAVGAKKLAVEFTAPVDPSKANIAVKRGTNNVQIASVEWSADKKTATITMVSKLFEATYTVNVTGVGEEVLTKDVAVQNEYVASIQFTSNDIIGEPREDNDTLKVNYKVYNQYGEEYNNAALNAFTNVVDADISASGGEVTISYADYNSKSPDEKKKYFKKDDVIYVSLHSQDAGVNVTKSFKIGEPARAVDLKIIGLHHDDNKTLDATATKDNVGDWKLIVEVYDQYGNLMTNATHLNADVAVYVNGKAVGVSSFKSGKIKDVNRTFLELTANEDDEVVAGQVTVIIMTKFATASAQYQITVAEGQIIDQFIVNPVGDLVAAGEQVKVPVTALDKNGAVINDAGKLTDKIGKGIEVQISGPYDSDDSNDKPNPEFVKDGENVYLEFTAPKKDGVVYVTILSESKKPSNHQFVTIREAAYPKVLNGIASGQNTLIFKQQSLELDEGAFIAEDQYGRQISKDSLNKMLKAGYKIEAYDVEDDGKVEIDSSKSQLTNTVKLTLKGNEKGSTEVFFRVIDPSNKPISGSEMSAVFRTVSLEEIDSIEIADIGTIYAHHGTAVTAYDREVKVSGVTADGKKVNLPASVYNVFYEEFVEYTSDGKLRIVFGNEDGLKKHFDDKSELTFTLRVVTEGGKGLSATKNVAYSKNGPSVSSVVFKEKGKDNTITSGKISAGTISLTTILSKFDIEIKDQYGVKADVAAGEFANGTGLPEPYVTFTNVKPAKSDQHPTITKNGFKDAQITAKAGDTFTVVVQYGSVSASLDITVE